jgi:hypothetical protein
MFFSSVRSKSCAHQYRRYTTGKNAGFYWELKTTKFPPISQSRIPNSLKQYSMLYTSNAKEPLCLNEQWRMPVGVETQQKVITQYLHVDHNGAVSDNSCN